MSECIKWVSLGSKKRNFLYKSMAALKWKINIWGDKICRMNYFEWMHKMSFIGKQERKLFFIKALMLSKEKITYEWTKWIGWIILSECIKWVLLVSKKGNFLYKSTEILKWKINIWVDQMSRMNYFQWMHKMSFIGKQERKLFV